MIPVFIQLLAMMFPWPLRRQILRALGWIIHPDAYIGLSIVRASKVEMAAGARIGQLTYIKGLARLALSEHATIGNLNWVTATPPSSRHFADQDAREPALVIGQHSAITHRHLIDCTDTVSIGSFTTFGGWRSQILTHSIDPKEGRQRAAPVRVGDYCFIGTSVIILKGTSVPDYSILAAGSVVSRSLEPSHSLFSGVPAVWIRSVDAEAKYFQRTVGFVL